MIFFSLSQQCNFDLLRLLLCDFCPDNLVVVALLWQLLSSNVQCDSQPVCFMSWSELYCIPKTCRYWHHQSCFLWSILKPRVRVKTPPDHCSEGMLLQCIVGSGMLDPETCCDKSKHVKSVWFAFVVSSAIQRTSSAPVARGSPEHLLSVFWNTSCSADHIDWEGFNPWTAET